MRIPSSQAHGVGLLVVALLACLVLSAHGAEWSKLKTCSALGFCRRHRASREQTLQRASRDRSNENPTDHHAEESTKPALSSSLRTNDGADGYRVVPESVHLTRWDSEEDGLWLAGLLVPSNAYSASGELTDAEPKIKFGVSVLPGGMFRLVVDDAVPTRHTRHTVKDVIMPTMRGLEFPASNAIIGRDRAEISVPETSMSLFGSSPAVVVVHYVPFRVDILRISSSASQGLEPLISFNAADLLRFESHVNKHVPMDEPERPTSVETDMPQQVNAEDDTSQTDYRTFPDHLEVNDEVDDESEEVRGWDEEAEDDYDSGHGFEDDFIDDVSADEEDEGNRRDTAQETSLDTVKYMESGLWEETFQSHTDPKVRGPESVGGDISFPFAQHLYGLPERTSRFSLEPTVAGNGSTLSEPYRLYNLDVFEFELDKPLGLYGAVPLILARKQGVSAAALWLNSAETYVDVMEPGTGGSGTLSHWFSETGKIDIYFMPGPTSEDVFRQYRLLTGPPAMPQRFSLGYHQCRWNYRDEPDVRAVDGEFDAHEIPYDVLWLDIEHTDGKRYFTWDAGKFPDPTKLQHDLAARGRKMVTIIDPHIKRDPNYAVHQFAEDGQHYVKTPEDKSYDGWCWPGSSSYFDFTCPKAREAWVTRFSPENYPHFTDHLHTWVDMNEPSVFNGPEGTMPKHMLHAGGVEHRDIHNQYGFYVQMATHEGLLQGHGGNDRPFVLARSFFAGSQRFGAVWTGDNTAGWDHLETTARMILPLQIAGIVFSGADVGGFFGNPSAELLVRWYQAAAFQPFFRGHAHLDTNRREPWLFGDSNTRLIATAIRVRYSYIPYWYTLMASNALANTIINDTTVDTGPPMRPLWWDFPGEARLDDLDDQWLVGPSLLVAPVLREGAAERTLYLPRRALWYDLYAPYGWTAPTSGGAEVSIPCALSRIIVFQRGGRIVPKQERRRRSSQAMATDPYTLVVAPDVNGQAVGELYLDDGKSFGHVSGAFVLRRFEYSHGKLKVRTLAGTGTGFIGENAVVERVVVLGNGLANELPTKALVQSFSDVGEFVEMYPAISVHPASGTVTVAKPSVLAGKGSWSIIVS